MSAWFWPLPPAFPPERDRPGADLVDQARRGCLSASRARREVRLLSWDQLMVEWARSGTALARAKASQPALALVELRAILLDEMERRRPRRFGAWFAAEQRRLHRRRR